MTTNNVDLFSYLPGLEVTENELLEAELLSQQILKAAYPTLDTREGTALRDLTIRPNANLLALINKALVFYYQNNTISEITDLTPQIFVDKMMSNWFLDRKIGVNAILNARLYFAKAKTVSLFTDVFFSTDGTLKFFPVASTTYAASDMIFESAANQYYIDVDLVAEKPGVAYNITTGSLLFFTNFDPFFLRAEINFLRNTAQDIETNTEFIGRAKNAISTRNNINVPSIDANLTANFTALNETKVVGFGDPEMIRDQILVFPPGVDEQVWIHNGGKVDVYCRTTLASSIIQLTANSGGTINITGPIYKIERSLVSGGTDNDTIPFNAASFSFNTGSTSAPLTSITRSGTVATATAPNHGLLKGERVWLNSETAPAYNAVFIVTDVPSKDTFTFTITGAPADPAPGDVGLICVDRQNDFGFSERQSLTVIYDPTYAGGTASFIIYYYENLDSYQAYLSSSNNRVLCGDLLARGFNMTLLDVTITAYNGPAPDAELCNTTIKTYLETLKAGQPFVMSDMQAKLADAGVTGIKTPILVTYTRYFRDLFSPITGTISDAFDPQDTTNIFMLDSVTTTNEAIPVV